LRKYLPHIALFTVNLIYALNYTIAKDVMPKYIQPFGFILLRVSGALLLFSLFFRDAFRQKIDNQDYLRIVLCGFFGVAFNQLTFFKGLSITTPINSAIIMTSTPILVLIVASILIKERISLKKIAGIVIGLSGAFYLIASKNPGKLDFSASTAWGDLLVLINALSYGIYLVLVKPLMNKYNAYHLTAWVFAIGWLFVFPVGISEVVQIEWSALPSLIIWEMLYVIVATTFLTYLLSMYALKKVSPVVVSSFIYLQPFLATVIAIALKSDTLSITKVIAGMLIFTGVYLVSNFSAKN
jgi:drug/metabolite transporter (DMT)-like permease